MPPSRAKTTLSQGNICSSPTKQMDCEECDTAFLTEKLVQCHRCRNMYCTKCADMKKSTLDVIRACSNIEWYCNPCKAPATEAVLNNRRIEEICSSYMEDFEKRIAQVEEKNTILEVALAASSDLQNNTNRDYEARLDQLEAKLQNFDKEPNDWQEIKTEIKVKLNEHSNNAASLSIKEIRDRDSRKANLILFNVPECDNEDTSARKTHDLEEVKCLCKALNCEDTFDKPVRLGPKSDKARPLKVIASDPALVTQMLKSAKNIPNLEGYKKVGLKRDMTFLEREEHRVLIKQRNQKMTEAKEKGQNIKWVIKNGNLIKIRPRDE